VKIPEPSEGVRGSPSYLACSDHSTAGQITSSSTGKQTRRKIIIDIIDPKTMKYIDNYEDSVASSFISPHSGKSIARNTPWPNTGPGTLEGVAELATLLAKAASE